METKFQTSFIPKSNSSRNEAYSYKTPFGIFLIVAISLATLSVILAIFVFAYKSILNKSISSKTAMIQKKSETFNTQEIDNLVKFGDKIESAENLLNSHIAVSPIFSLLEQTTLQRLQFTEFTFTYLASNKIAVAMKGVATNFGVVARQSDAFSAVVGSKFTSPIFTNLSINDNGQAVFNFLTTVDPNLVLYKNTLSKTQ